MTLLGVPATFFAFLFFVGVVIAFGGLIVNAIADNWERSAPRYFDKWSREFLFLKIPGVSVVLAANLVLNVVVWSLLILNTLG